MIDIDIINRGVFKEVRIIITEKETEFNLGLIEPKDQPELAEAFYRAWVLMKGKGLEQGLQLED